MREINKRTILAAFLVLIFVNFMTTLGDDKYGNNSFGQVIHKDDLVVATMKDLTDNAYSLSGRIKEKGDNYFIVTADVVDFSKIDNINFSNLGTLLPTIAKDYRINITEQTDFTSEKFNQAFLSGYITIESKEGIYTTDILTAKSVTIPPAWETSIIAEKNRKINEELRMKSNF